VTQQINLLIEKQRRPVISSERALIALGLLLVASLAYAMVERNKTARVQEAVKSGEARLVGERASVKAMQDKLAERPNADQLNAEVAYLNELASNKQRVLQELRVGGGGSESGYYDHLVSLAKVSENGVWVIGLSISNSGTRMAIEGRALSAEPVVHYAQRLNEQFEPYGVRFSTLEIASQSVTNDRGSTVQIVKFSLR
jgi:hypothetical protein